MKNAVLVISAKVKQLLAPLMMEKLETFALKEATAQKAQKTLNLAP